MLQNKFSYMYILLALKKKNCCKRHIIRLSIPCWFFYHHRYGSILIVECDLVGGDSLAVRCRSVANLNRTSSMHFHYLHIFCTLGAYSCSFWLSCTWRSSATDRYLHFSYIFCCWRIWSNQPGTHLTLWHTTWVDQIKTLPCSATNWLYPCSAGRDTCIPVVVTIMSPY